MDSIKITDYARDWVNEFTTHKENLNDFWQDIASAAYEAGNGGPAIVEIPLRRIYNNDLVYYTLGNPEKARVHIRAALEEVLEAFRDNPKTWEIGITAHPRPVGIRTLRAKDIGKLVAVRGLVKQVTAVSPKVISGAYQCRSCGTVQIVNQLARTCEAPIRCIQDGCNSRVFTLVIEQSSFIDNQKIRLQDMPEGLKAGAQPDSLDVEADGLLGQIVNGGDRVIFTGILRAEAPTGIGKASTSFVRYLELTGVERLDEDLSDIVISDEDVAQITTMRQDPQFISNMIRSIAPSIYGHETIKLAIAMQLFGGILKETDDGTNLRGDFHILLCGDPGIAKSRLARYAAELSPRGIFASGKSSSTAGLTATAVKDAFGDGRWSLEAGAMVLADGGVLVLDEIDKMAKDDLIALHEGMEQQSVTLNKAGIHTTLRTRCAVLAAANPISSRFDLYQPLAAQVNLPATILDRFDLIFFMQDIPNPEIDRLIAGHILKSHEIGRHGAKIEGPYSAKVLRKYIAYAKQNCIPKMTEEANQVILSYYLKMRKTAMNADTAIPITARQMEGLVRLAEAHARMRLSETILGADARAIVELVDSCLKQVAYDHTTKTFDIDKISGVPKKQRDVMGIVKEAITANMDVATKRAKLNDVMNQLTVSRGIDPKNIEETIENMCRAGILLRPNRHELAFL